MGDKRMQDNLKEWDFWIDPLSKIGYVRVVAFTETTVEELTKVVDALQKTGMRGLVVDLRSNPGGLLRAAVDVCSLFMPEGKNVVTTKGRNNATEDVYRSHNKSPVAQPGTYYPIAILINRYSASASEIVAAALQDHARAVIIGERSYGKGSVQNLIPMENGTSALKITTASYWRPSGRNIHRFPDSKEKDEWGVSPDKGFDVKQSDEERVAYFKYRRDRDIVRRDGEAAPKPAEPEAKEEKDEAKKKEPFRDRVLDKALEYLKGALAKEQPKKQDPGAQAPAPPANQPGARLDPEASRERSNAIARRERAFQSR
jgi:carboxyl-terminal processing protease